MKKILLFILGVTMSIVSYSKEIKKVAILEVVDREGQLSYSQKLMIRSNMSRAIANTDGFEAYDRTDIDAIFSEHDFQRTGNVSEKDIKKLGEMTGAAYILVVEGALAEQGKIFLMAKILSVETAKMENTDNVLTGSSSDALQRGCRTLANKMFGDAAGSSTSTNKFVDFFKVKPKNK